ncbi:DUF6969 family protein [Qipengyuania sp. CAU 1752]
MAQGPMPARARQTLLAISGDMARQGTPLITRVLPEDRSKFQQWTHYPPGDAIDPVSGARWYYHAHPPEQRGESEHGHFHIFLPLSAFAGVNPMAKPKESDAPAVVHVASLGFDTDGLPTEWSTVAHRITDDYAMPAEAIIARLDQLRLDRAGEKQGIAGVGRWLTLALEASREDIEAILIERDERLATYEPGEILSSRPFRLD